MIQCMNSDSNTYRHVAGWKVSLHSHTFTLPQDAFTVIVIGRQDTSQLFNCLPQQFPP